MCVYLQQRSEIMKIKLGDKVKDRITGYTGIVTCRYEWLFGCVRINVQSQELHEGKPVEAYAFDEDQLELVSSNVVMKSDEKAQQKVPPGGPRDNPICRRDPPR
jgi:hypothetical protein